MTTTRDPDRLLRAWLDLMPDEAPDRVVSAVLQAVEATPQTRGLRLLGPRRSSMNRLSLIAAVAVIAAALLGGALLLTSGHSNAPLAPTAQVTASPAASTPKPSVLNVSAGYTNVQGWIVFEHFGQAPDGSTTTFDPENRMIWLVHADGSGLHELAPGDPKGKFSPDISSDGSKVVFADFNAPKVYEAPIAGGASREVAINCPTGVSCAADDPAYAADGHAIAFVREEAIPAGKTTSVLVITDLTTGTSTTLESTRVDLATAHVAQPSWSPDGSQIVYYRTLKTEAEEHPTDTRLFIASTDDSATRELPRPAGAWAADPDWSPDGSLIVFSTAPNRETEGWGFPNFHGMYTIRPDGTGLTQICDTCLEGGWAPSWTPDGKHILFWGFRSWGLMDADGKNAAHVNQPKLTWFGETLGYGYAAFLQPTN